MASPLFPNNFGRIISFSSITPDEEQFTEFQKQFKLISLSLMIRRQYEQDYFPFH